MKSAFTFYSEFFGKAYVLNSLDEEKLIIEYEQSYSNAVSLGLFKSGGISGKDHLNFWCLGQIFSPERYIESGVFIGSSLHSFIGLSSLKQVIAIDPNLTNLKIPTQDIPNVVLVENKDFSEIEIEYSTLKTLVCFDDHINTADRIIQAYQKG